MNKNQRKLLLTKLAQEVQADPIKNEAPPVQGEDFANKIFDQLLDQLLVNLDKDLGL